MVNLLISRKKKSRARLLHTQPPVKASRMSTTTIASHHSSTSQSSSSSSKSLMMARPTFLSRPKSSKSTSRMTRMSISTSQKRQSRPTAAKTGSSTSNEKILEIDQNVQSRYRIFQRLGKGAYGIVWKARDTQDGRTVALKKIFDAFRNDTDAQRTYREIVFLQELGSHPNIISLINVHRAANDLDLYLVFPLQHSDLHKVIQERPPLSITAATSIFFQILKAVRFLHAAEVIHRDLKPANILLDKMHNVKLADFGLARSLPETTPEEGQGQDGLMTDYVATRWYRPPEVLMANERYHKGIDIWGLGCIFAEMLLGRALYAGNSTMEQLQLIMSSIRIPPLHQIQELSGTPANIAFIQAAIIEKRDPLRKMLQKNGCSMLASSLVEKFLAFHPNNRITIDRAMSSSFFSSLRNQPQELPVKRISPTLDDNVRLPMHEYRKMIYQMMTPDFKGLHVHPQISRPSRQVVDTFTNYRKPRSIFTLRRERPGTAGPGKSSNLFQPITTSKDDLAHVSEIRRAGLCLKKTQSSVAISSSNQLQPIKMKAPLLQYSEGKREKVRKVSSYFPDNSTGKPSSGVVPRFEMPEPQLPQQAKPGCNLCDNYSSMYATINASDLHELKNLSVQKTTNK